MSEIVDADEIDGSCAPVARVSICSVELDGETVIYDADTGVSHLLNKTGTLVWRCMDGETRLDELVADLVAVYAAPESVVRADVFALVCQLGRQGLLEGVA